MYVTLLKKFVLYLGHCFASVVVIVVIVDVVHPVVVFVVFVVFVFSL